MALIGDALRTCDIELRQILGGNIVLTGGGSQFTGVADRLASEIARTFQHVCISSKKSRIMPADILLKFKGKIHAPGNPIERRYGGWLGGSILASLGTFHQLWISREEWQVSLSQILSYF